MSGTRSGSGTSGAIVSSCSRPSTSATLHTTASRIARSPWLTSTRCDDAGPALLAGLDRHVDRAELRDVEVVARERRRPQVRRLDAAGPRIAHAAT